MFSDFMLKNGGSKNGGSKGVVISYTLNKHDITAYFNKRACKVYGIDKGFTLHFNSVEDLKNAIQAYHKEYNIKDTPYYKVRGGE